MLGWPQDAHWVHPWNGAMWIFEVAGEGQGRRGGCFAAAMPSAVPLQMFFEQLHRGPLVQGVGWAAQCILSTTAAVGLAWTR